MGTPATRQQITRITFYWFLLVPITLLLGAAPPSQRHPETWNMVQVQEEVRLLPTHARGIFLVRASSVSTAANFHCQYYQYQYKMV